MQQLRQQHRLRLSAGVLASSAALLAFAPAGQGATAQVADCAHGPVTIGSGSADWRRSSLIAGPLGVARRPLSQMTRTANGQLIAKMPLLVEGHSLVRLVVPRAERRRVFLYYGRFRDRQGRPTTLIGRAPGFSEVTFEPCDDRPRTVWLGGIRIRGSRPVRLDVAVEGRERRIPLRLGRPQVLRRS